MCFVELYERFAIFGTKDHLQSFLSEMKATQVNTMKSVVPIPDTQVYVKKQIQTN